MDKETAEKEERIVKAYRNGFGAYLLARLHSTTPQKIKDILIRNGITPHKSGYNTPKY